VGRIGIELPDVLKNEHSGDNLPLQDGDSLYIPRYNAVVNVQGAVNSPVSVTYSSGKTIEYYLRAAGGPTQKADVKRSYVTQPNGKVEARETRFLLPDGVPHPLPGSTVFVPQKDPADRQTDVLASIAVLAQVFAGLATVVLALKH
jgi:polysaccharide export outer membrane protein